MNAHKSLCAFATLLVFTSLATTGAHAQSNSNDPPPDAPATRPAVPLNVLTGTVVDDQGQAIAGATVAVVDAKLGNIYWEDEVYALAPDEKFLLFFTKPNGKRSATAMTDGAGKFTITGLKHGQYHAAVIEPDVGATLIPDLSYTKDDAQVRFVRHLGYQVMPTLTLKGRVLDTEGRPVRRATVAAADRDHGFLWLEIDTLITTTKNGNELENAPPRFAPGVREGTTEHLDGYDWFEVGFGRSGEHGTDRTGRFAIQGLRPGTYHVVALHETDGTALAKDVELTESTGPLELKLEPPAFVEGTITGLKLPTGLGAYTARLVAEGLPDNTTFRHTVDLRKEPQFHLGPLPPADAWRLVLNRRVRANGYDATILDAPFEAGKLTIDLNEGERLTGEVRGPNGEALRNVSVLAKPVGGHAPALGAVTGKDGTYTIKGLGSGEYELQALRHAKRTAPG